MVAFSLAAAGFALDYAVYIRAENRRDQAAATAADQLTRLAAASRAWATARDPAQQADAVPITVADLVAARLVNADFPATTPLGEGHIGVATFAALPNGTRRLSSVAAAEAGNPSAAALNRLSIVGPQALAAFKARVAARLGGEAGLLGYVARPDGTLTQPGLGGASLPTWAFGLPANATPIAVAVTHISPRGRLETEAAIAAQEAVGAAAAKAAERAAQIARVAPPTDDIRLGAAQADRGTRDRAEQEALVRLTPWSPTADPGDIDPLGDAGGWSRCSSPFCGPGTQDRYRRCVRVDGSFAPMLACGVSVTGDLQHETRPCTTVCTAAYDDWSVCSGPGVWTASDWGICNGGGGASATGTWQASDWSSCSNTCGAGEQTRSVWCDGGAGTMERDVACSVVPGGGTQTRTGRCLNSRGEVVPDSFCPALATGQTQACTPAADSAMCDPGTRPVTTEACGATCDPATQPTASQACDTTPIGDPGEGGTTHWIDGKTLFFGTVGDNYWDGWCDPYEITGRFWIENPAALTRFHLTRIVWDDHTILYVNGHRVFSGPNDADRLIPRHDLHFSFAFDADGNPLQDWPGVQYTETEVDSCERGINWDWTLEEPTDLRPYLRQGWNDIQSRTLVTQFGESFFWIEASGPGGAPVCNAP